MQYDGHFGDWLRASLMGAGMSQAELAERAGITENTICGHINGAHIPNMFTLSRIISAIPGASWADAITAIREDIELDPGCLSGELLF